MSENQAYPESDEKSGYKFKSVLEFQWLGLTKYNSMAFKRHAKSFNPEDLKVDATGKTVMITGANSGLGYEATREIAARGGSVIMICRNLEKGTKARDEIVQKTGNNKLELVILDISRPLEIKRFATDFVNSGRKLDYLVNNAGILVHERKETPEGYESTFATHTIGTFLLTEWLMPALMKSPAGAVLITTSAGAYPVRVDVDDLQSLAKPASSFDGYKAYAYQKRCQIYLTEYWTAKYGSRGVTFNTWHPGWSNTEGVASSMPKFFKLLNPRSPIEGADTMIWLILTDEAKKTSGKIFFDREVEGEPDFNKSTVISDVEKRKIYSQMEALEERWRNEGSNLPSEKPAFVQSGVTPMATSNTAL
eukprot:TRINITY_DN1102_c0_g1_i1.p1 TRINITY_DN1102_c0_g1~~TRINITY_DN1102_c0_g1_i1.p1  ORF type:complete len:364 (-),score=115.36 TRINITY_DN1102_c0_g1_i1:45-1136(-)